MDGDVPSGERFEDAVGGLLDEVARRFPEKTIRAFGEMVDLLFQRGQQATAIALEELWNRALESRRCALLCGYELDVFDLDTQTSALPEIIRTHTHPRPVADTARLAAAVHRDTHRGRRLGRGGADLPPGRGGGSAHGAPAGAGRAHVAQPAPADDGAARPAGRTHPLRAAA